MKLVTFRGKAGTNEIGAVVGEQVISLNACLADGPPLPTDMVEFLAQGAPAMARAREAIERYSSQGHGDEVAVPLAQANLMAPVPRPGKIMMGGRNYLKHLDELRKEGASREEKIITPPLPHIFAKYADSVTGPGHPVVYPPMVKQLDFEGELTAVIGRRAHHVTEDEAMDYVAGYTIMNDVSARCLQAQGLLTVSKGFETFCPMGPWIVTSDELTDPQRLSVITYINGQEVSRANTADMLFSVRQFVAHLSKVFPLEPGDVISTGSPPGPGLYKDPPVLTSVGDVMRIEIEGVGVLENPVVAATR